MNNEHPLKDIVRKQKQGFSKGVYSICSANEYVIEASMEYAAGHGEYVLIEATANQVNQFGGYTGMKPADFRDFVFCIADKVAFSREKIILGGDHLGPLMWKAEPSQPAMEKAEELVKEYVLAGFTKIHLDTSMHLGDDDKNKKLDTNVIAQRGARLCAVAEDAFKGLAAINKDAVCPIYVVGSEVPIPGGSQKEESLQVTKVKDFEETVELFHKAFIEFGLSKAWQNVIAVVVQPGVEFGDHVIHEYDRIAAAGLKSSLQNFEGIVFEGHSTDYQTPKSLRQMVQDGIAILKVGPALTFALREALFALCNIEKELFEKSAGKELSGFIETLEKVMLDKPEHWEKHYHGEESKLKLARKYSMSDRCRYYLPEPAVKEAIDKLIRNLSDAEIPLTLISQFMPIQYMKIRSGKLDNSPVALLKDRIVNLLDEYRYAVL